MKLSEDRRSQNARRVSVATLVDICTQGGDISPFQAQSANLSGRGMQVSTSHLPEVGDELVCRFNQDDQEILVEGRVAWRSEGVDSGEFGIQFTALDGDSAHILQNLGEADSAPPSAKLDAPIEDEEAEEEALCGGDKVKLHIEGLGAPMKACVHEGSLRKVRVGSSLEFLKVGRTLEIEDLEGGGKRGAHVDSVNVVINPSTAVPELVVQLRYEGVTPTPAPAGGTVDYEDEVFDSIGKGRTSAAVSAAHDQGEEVDEFSDEDPAPWEPAAEALRVRLGGAARSASLAAQKATGLVGGVAHSARLSVSSAVSRRTQAGSRDKGGKSSKDLPTKRRQTTRRQSRVAPSYLRSGIHEAGLAGKNRPLAGSRRSERERQEPAKAASRRLRPAAFFALAVLVFGGSALSLRSLGDAAGDAAIPETSLSASAKMKSSETKKSGEEPRKSQPARPAIPAKKIEKGVVAEVPLFGAQAMAVERSKKPLTEAQEVRAEKRAAAAAVPDEKWEDAPKEKTSTGSAPWGRGRLYLPTIHRIRLDGVGASVVGSVSEEGFTVVVPGRKAMESGKSIQKRDKRITVVKTNNNARGATVKFQFRGPVPPYRVRLRKDFVEFLISAPEDTIAKL